MADLVGGLDEGAADIVVSDDAELEGNPGGIGIADGGGYAGVGDRDHDVGLDRRLPRQLGADSLPRLVDARPFDDAVGPREVDVLKNTEAPAGRRERPQRMDAGAVQHDELAGLDVAHELRADNVEGAGFRRQDVTRPQAPERKRQYA